MKLILFQFLCLMKYEAFMMKAAIFLWYVFGFPSLLNQLNLSVNLPLKQRISLFLECSGFSLVETKEYIIHQLDLAKCKDPVFDENCFPLIHSMTSGAPRRINQFCYFTMLQAIN